MKKILILSVILSLGLFSVTFAYTDEEKKAYNYAFNKGITTMTTIENANMEGNLTRIAMAKMISNYATNVLKLKLDTTKKCKFADVTNQRDKQYDYGVTHVCQLGLMGIGDDGKIATKFNPEGKLNKAQLVTILSRVLNRANGKEMANGNPYYQTHLAYLNSIGVTKEKNFSAYDDALRKEVMVLIYRSANSNFKTNSNSTGQNTSKTNNTSQSNKPKTGISSFNYEKGYTKLDPNESYFNEFYGVGIKHKGNYPWLVNIDNGTITYGVIIPEKIGNCSVGEYKSELQANAKKFNIDGLLINIETKYIIKKGSDDWTNRESIWKWSGEPVPETSNKGYTTVYDSMPKINQISPYEEYYKCTEESDIYTLEGFNKLIGNFEFYIY